MGQLILFTAGNSRYFHVGVSWHTDEKHLLRRRIDTGHDIHIAPAGLLQFPVNVHTAQINNKRLLCDRKIRNVLHKHLGLYIKVIDNPDLLEKSRIIFFNELIQRLIINHRINFPFIQRLNQFRIRIKLAGIDFRFPLICSIA